MKGQRWGSGKILQVPRVTERTTLRACLPAVVIVIGGVRRKTRLPQSQWVLIGCDTHSLFRSPNLESLSDESRLKGV